MSRIVSKFLLLALFVTGSGPIADGLASRARQAAPACASSQCCYSGSSVACPCCTSQRQAPSECPPCAAVAQIILAVLEQDQPLPLPYPGGARFLTTALFAPQLFYPPLSPPPKRIG